MYYIEYMLGGPPVDVVGLFSMVSGVLVLAAFKCLFNKLGCDWSSVLCDRSLQL